MNDVRVEDIRALPKVELHRHLEGTARPGTVRELAEKHGRPEPDLSQWYDYDDLTDFLAVFGTVCSVLVDADDYRRVAYESVEDAAAAGVIHTEMFFTPHEFLGRGVSFDTAWQGIEAGVRDGERDFGVSVRMIMDVDKASGPGPALEQVEMCRERGDYLIGVGGDGEEAGVDDRALQPAFDLAARYGLHCTLHAGEFSARSVADAIRYLGCERIDHGPLVLRDRELVAEAVDRRVAFTVCPSSDVIISKVYPEITDHPLSDMLASGLIVSLGSDDPALLGYDLADEYQTVLEVGLVDADGLRRIALDGVTACWLPDDDKARLRQRVEPAWAAATGLGSARPQ
ncbi:MAG TPA: adenosine deaminase [Actinomycetes bacterium]|nr:adenosine deaminase [Actinomycetes bacterium]